MVLSGSDGNFAHSPKLVHTHTYTYILFFLSVKGHPGFREKDKNVSFLGLWTFDE